jgi:hypothetical protein
MLKPLEKKGVAGAGFEPGISPLKRIFQPNFSLNFESNSQPAAFALKFDFQLKFNPCFINELILVSALTDDLRLKPPQD